MATAIPIFGLHAAESWPLWNRYADRFMSADGRIVDPASQSRTTSEGQAYAMFFALVANDRKRFDQLLEWTSNNLAGGDPGSKLPAWNWGSSASGSWTVLDSNSASDADLWLAYTLLEAGRLWNEPRFTALGRRLADLIARCEIEELPKLGAMLLPGVRDFKVGRDVFLNPSYTPLQLALGISSHRGPGPWRRLAANVPALVEASAPRGFALDWISYRNGHGFTTEAPSGKKAVAGYDAIRVYLWAGMLPNDAPSRSRLLHALRGMSRVLSRSDKPPAVVGLDGAVEDPNGSAGFSAALIPFLQARGESQLAARQKQRVHTAFNRQTGLYGTSPDYYDHNLILFSLGWLENRYRFTSEGALTVEWR